MRRTRTPRCAGPAILASLGLLAAACGGGDDGDTAAGRVDAEVKDEVQSQLGTTSDTATADEAPSSMDEWEALWAEERAAIVARAEAEGWGVSADGSTLTGPEGFQVDLAACGQGWSDTEGITETSVKIGWPAPYSGPIGDFGHVVHGADVILQARAAEGAFTDPAGNRRAVEIISRDDAYDPARTVPLVDELIDSEGVFATFIMGTPNLFAVYDKLNERCVPNPFAYSGHPAWGDPVNHPWTSGALLSYSTEAVLWGSYIEEHLDEWGGQVKVASLLATNDFGASYDGGFRAFLAQSPRGADIEYITERIEVDTPTIKDPMTTLAAQDPDVFIAMVPGSPLCTQVIVEAAENGMRAELDAAFLSSVCKPSTFIGKDKVGGDGSVADGWQVVGGGVKDYNADAYSDDPWVAWARERLAEAGYDYRNSSNFLNGAGFGWAISQALQIAQELPGGLTRSNFILALRGMDMTNPALLHGIGYNMNGNADAYLIEGSDISHWDAAAQGWVTDTIVELSGASELCAWDQSLGRCG